MTWTRLLGKSSELPDAPKPEQTLPGHTSRVLSSARRILAKVGERALTAAALDPADWLPRFEFAVTFAAAIHDLGKASDQFQALVRRRLQHPQSARHEAITGLLMLGPLREPLFELACERDELAAWTALIAACGHHRKFPNDEDEWRVHPSSTDLTVHTDHPDFCKTCSIVAKILQTEAPELEPPSWSIGTRRSSLEPALDELLEQIDDEFERLTRTAEARRFAALVRGLLFGADVAGSALPREQLKISAWIDATLGERLTASNLDEILETRLRGHELRGFQRAIGSSRTTVTLVTAGCGTGKTAAAYAWARHHAHDRKLVFCYPTTGTTTEGFRGYLHDTDVASALVHSRALIDLEDMTVTGHDEDDHKDSLGRLEALRSWPARVTACTADTVLGALVLNRAGLFAFPVLCESAFVFDEVHAYDSRMFSLLLRLLELLPRTPVLLMTASMPDSRKQALHTVVADITEVPGPRDIEDHPRYILTPDPLAAPPWDAIDRVLRQGGKVLWVSNTVARAIERAEQWRARGGSENTTQLVYHSRFRYEDRKNRHAEVIRAFDPKATRPAIACTTQVCEMSLDLSADLLITDIAPPAALVQRLGRLNRRATPDNDDAPKPAHCLSVPFSKPYEDLEIDAGLQFWRSLADREIVRSQADLNRAFLATTPHEAISKFDINLRDTARSIPAPVREAGVASINILLPQDHDRVAADRLELQRCVIPIPYRAEIIRWPDRVHGVPIAPEGTFNYDERLGLKED